MKLELNHEVIGILSDFLKEKNQIKLIFNIMIEVEVPLDALPNIQLKDFLDNRIGILNLDGIYKIRHIKKNSKYGGDR
jgi:hypothetical protein